LGGKNANSDDLIERNNTDRESVENRIERRLEVLRNWLESGVPAGKSFPRSLAEARKWEDEELEILPIASPNEFTTTHCLHGRSVRDIGGLLTELKKRYDRPKRSSLKRSVNPKEKFDRKAFDRQLETAISQWHSERDKHLHQKRRADSADARSTLLLVENAQKDEQIADLQSRLVAHEGLRSVK